MPQLTQQQKMVKDLHRAAKKEGELKLSAKKMQQMGEQFDEDFMTGGKRLEVLGVDAISYAGGLPSPMAVRGYSRGHEELVIDAKKAESYQQKESKQEKAAIKRGEYSSYRTDRTNVAQDAIRQYKSMLHMTDSSTFQDADGQEFIYKSGETDAVAAARICRLMRSRVLLNHQINQLKGSTLETDRLWVKHKTEFWFCMDDAIKTWQLANGIDENGQPVSPRIIEKARKHLPLALEKYEFMSRNHMKNYGKEVVRCSQVRNHKEWVDAEANLRSDDADRVKRLDIPAGLRSIDTDAAQDLQQRITANPQTYQANKAKIDKLFGFYIQRLRKVNEVTWEATLAKGVATGIYPKASRVSPSRPEEERLEKGIDALINASSYETMPLIFQSECAEKCIDFLLTGHKCDAAHAAYIERTWGIKAYKQDISEPVDRTVAEFTAVRTAFSARIDELIRRRDAAPDGEDRMALEVMIIRLTCTEDNAVVKRAVLSAFTDEGIAVRRLQDAIKDRSGMPLIIPGFTNMALGLTTLGSAPAITSQELTDTADALAIVKTGSDISGNAASPQAQQAAMTGVITAFRPAYSELESFIGAHPEMLAKRTQPNLLKNGAELPAFMEKAVAVRDAYMIAYNSPLFDGLPQNEKIRLRTEFIHLQAMAHAAQKLFNLQKRFCVMSTERYVSTQMDPALFDEASFDWQLANQQALINGAQGRIRQFGSLGDED